MYWISAIIIFAILLAVGIWFLQKFYAKATLETALVRTGMGGRRVLTDGGCLALPIVHQCQLLDNARSTVYYRAEAVNDIDDELMKRIDAIHLA